MIMRLVVAAAENLRLFAVLSAFVGLAFAAFGLALGLELSITGVSADTSTTASSDPADTIQVCVNANSLNLDKIEPPGVEAVCLDKEFLLEWLDVAGTNALDARITALETEGTDQQTALNELTTEVGTPRPVLTH
jgi:hypothetical protein